MADAYSILPLDAKPHLGGTPSLMRHRILMLWDIAHLREVVILPRIEIRPDILILNGLPKQQTGEDLHDFRLTEEEYYRIEKLVHPTPDIKIKDRVLIVYYQTQSKFVKQLNQQCSCLCAQSRPSHARGGLQGASPDLGRVSISCRNRLDTCLRHPGNTLLQMFLSQSRHTRAPAAVGLFLHSSERGQQ